MIVFITKPLVLKLCEIFVTNLMLKNNKIVLHFLVMMLVLLLLIIVHFSCGMARMAVLMPLVIGYRKLLKHIQVDQNRMFCLPYILINNVLFLIDISMLIVLELCR